MNFKKKIKCFKLSNSYIPAGFCLLAAFVSSQRRFESSQKRQMFDRMQRAQQDSYGEKAIYIDVKAN